jgi:hypothetical protein
MPGPKTRFHSALIEKIEAERISLLESIATGACADYSAYQHKCGILQGFSRALDLCEDIEKEFN